MELFGRFTVLINDRYLLELLVIHSNTRNDVSKSKAGDLSRG